MESNQRMSMIRARGGQAPRRVGEGGGGEEGPTRPPWREPRHVDFEDQKAERRYAPPSKRWRSRSRWLGEKRPHEARAPLPEERPRDCATMFRIVDEAKTAGMAKRRRRLPPLALERL